MVVARGALVGIETNDSYINLHVTLTSFFPRFSISLTIVKPDRVMTVDEKNGGLKQFTGSCLNASKYKKKYPQGNYLKECVDMMPPSYTYSFDVRKPVNNQWDDPNWDFAGVPNDVSSNKGSTLKEAATYSYSLVNEVLVKLCEILCFISVCKVLSYYCSTHLKTSNITLPYFCVSFHVFFFLFFPP